MNLLNLINAIVLGLVQGLTEFLPISSSAHIRIVGEWLGMGADPGAAFTAIAGFFHYVGIGPDETDDGDEAEAAEARVSAEAFAAAKWQLVHPVSIDDVRSVEIRYATVLLGEPRIDNLAAEAEALKLVDSFGVGALVD